MANHTHNTILLMKRRKLLTNDSNKKYYFIAYKTGKIINITYLNDDDLDYGEYKIIGILINNKLVQSINIDELKTNDEIKVILND